MSTGSSACAHCPTPAPGLRSALAPLRGRVILVALAALATLAGWLLSMAGLANWPLYMVALLAGGAPAAWQAGGALLRGRVNVDLLMVVAALGAVSIGAWAEGALLLMLFALGGLLEEISLARTENAVASLMSLRPDVVHRVSDDGVEDTAPGDVTPGEVIRVLPGERVALDGVVIGGAVRIETAALTGESALRTVDTGDEVLAGSIVADAALELRVLRDEAESTLSRMIDLVATARETTTRTGALIDRWLGRYVLAVLVICGGIFLALSATGSPDAFLQAMTFLVVASPCALVIGLPATILSSLAAAARAGILVKGATPLLALGEAQVVMLDKTGTLTTGHPTLSAAAPQGISRGQLLEWAAACEAISGHPLAEAIRRACPSPPQAHDHLLLPGEGVEATITGVGRIAVLSPAAAAARGVDDMALKALDQASGACVLQDGRLVGTLEFADPLRPESAAAVADLAVLGLEVQVLSGDRPHLAEQIGAAVGAARSRGNLTPAAKLEVIAHEERPVGAAWTRRLKPGTPC